MEPMDVRVVDILKQGSVQFSNDLNHIMETLDNIGILHNDGNVLNLMLDHNDCLKILDFGLSKEITPAIRKKWQGSPNKRVTLFMMKKGLRKYNINV